MIRRFTNVYVEEVGGARQTDFHSRLSRRSSCVDDGIESDDGISEVLIKKVLLIKRQEKQNE